MTLTGMKALVTGGNRGIGLATTRALALAGAEVHFTSRTAASIAEAQRALGDLPATGHHADMTDRIAMTRVIEQGFDILINNAAMIGPIGRMLDIQVEDFAHSIDVNLTSAFHAIQLALPAMLARGAGTIINISSGAAHRPQEGWSAYCAGKAGLAMLTKATHLEYGPQGVRVIGLAPGIVDTDMQGRIRASGLNPVSKIPRSDLAPTDIPAQMITWLCSPEAADLAGQELDIRQPELRARAGLPPLP